MKFDREVSFDEIGGRPLDGRRRTANGLRSNPHGLGGGSVFLETEDCSAPASPKWVGADAAASSGWPSIRWRYGPALPLLFVIVLGIGCHLLSSGVPNLKDRQPRSRLLYIKQKGTVASPKGFLTGSPSFQSETFSQPDSRRTKRKSYFQYFTLDFFLMVIMNPGLLLKQYHPKSPVSLGAVWTSHAINCYTFGGRLVHRCIRLRDYEDVPYRQKCRNDRGVKKVTAGTILRIRAGRGSRELWPLQEEEEVSLEIELVLVEATSAPSFDELGAGRGLPSVPSANNSSGDLM
ncbi:hypothetical protein Cgig2_019931 [Carnegiea gigantea]|uniref:Uncharacterized protein n=1 Tax=Carnegiea gigantea TaxID=171969 RepID=A0A9Q1QIZ2_9CARY|nr:hypothetical protein Cgig2_019931 [Carnegiea gigantea]